MKHSLLLTALMCKAALPHGLRQARRWPAKSSEFANSLERLAVAVEQGDVPMVELITSALKDEAQRRSQKNQTRTSQSGTPSRESNTAKALPQHIASPVALHASTDGCIFDDRIFGLDAKAKAELAYELDQPTMTEALDWVRYGGWWTCAVYGEMCTCHGEVRMVDWDRTAWSAANVDASNFPGNKVKCELSSFDNIDPKPGSWKICECAAPQKQGKNFSLKKRLTSASYLQEAWILLLRILGRTALLPMGTGDRLYHGLEHWAARQVPGNMPLVLERVWIEMFVKQVVLPATSTLHKCLEWGNPLSPGSGFNYLNMLPQCNDKWDMQFDAVFHGTKHVGIEGNVVYSDIDRLPSILTLGADNRMDLIFATQVFEHVHNPKTAAKQLLDSLRPGGVLVFTAPQQAQFHRVPHDFFRYSKEGALQVLQEAGFCVPQWAFAGGGDFVFDIARDAGLQVQDFPNEEINGAFQMGFDKVSDSAITIHVLAFKPPHPECKNAMAPVMPPVDVMVPAGTVLGHAQR